MIEIYNIVQQSEMLEEVKKLFREYLAELNEDLRFQHWDEELENPLRKYGERGCILLALSDEQPAGCVALQQMKDKSICEMKRLYVTPQYRNKSIGDKLVQELIKYATGNGFNKMVLDTLERLQPAIKLYEKHGFVHTSAYYNNPLPGVVFMQKILQQ